MVKYKCCTFKNTIKKNVCLQMKSLKVKEWCEKIKVNRFLFRTHKKKYLMTWNMYNPVTRVQNRDVSQRKDVIYKKRLFLWLQWLDNSEFTKKNKEFTAREGNKSSTSKSREQPMNRTLSINSAIYWLHQMNWDICLLRDYMTFQFVTTYVDVDMGNKV